MLPTAQAQSASAYPPPSPALPQEESSQLHRKHNPIYPREQANPLYAATSSLKKCLAQAIKMLTVHLRGGYLKFVHTNIITYKNNKQCFNYVYIQVICIFS